MHHIESYHRVPLLITCSEGRSAWADIDFPTEARGGMILSPRIDCTSLRLRSSRPGYLADWHVAGEPVLIIVRQGVLRIGLRDDSTRDFAAGDAFIAADQVPEGETFDADIHGHTAKVASETTLKAVHIKLSGLDL